MNFEIEIPKGVEDSYKITLHGKGNQDVGCSIGDISITLKTASHPIFHREGADLLYHKSISVTEALCGVDFTLQYLHGHNIRVKSPEGKCVKDGS